MANRTIHFSQLEIEIVKALSEYSEEVAEGVQKEVEDAGKRLPPGKPGSMHEDGHKRRSTKAGMTSA